MDPNFNDDLMVDHRPDEIVNYIASLVNHDVVTCSLICNFNPIFVEVDSTQHAHNLLLRQYGRFPWSALRHGRNQE